MSNIPDLKRQLFNALVSLSLLVVAMISVLSLKFGTGAFAEGGIFFRIPTLLLVVISVFMVINVGVLVYILILRKKNKLDVNNNEFDEA